MDSTFAAISAIPSPALVKHQKYLDTAGSVPHLDTRWFALISWQNQHVATTQTKIINNGPRTSSNQSHLKVPTSLSGEIPSPRRRTVIQMEHLHNFSFHFKLDLIPNSIDIGLSSLDQPSVTICALVTIVWLAPPPFDWIRLTAKRFLVFVLFWKMTQGILLLLKFISLLP